MRLLALESATAAASVAVLEENRVVGEFYLNTEKTHSERLMPLLNDVLDYCGFTLGDMDGFAVSIGPGSFTGLRIGLATVKGLAYFSGKPVVGIPTLDALANNAVNTPGLICPVVKARKDEFYTALYVHSCGALERISDYICLSPGKLSTLLSGVDRRKITFLGDAVDMLNDDFRSAVGPGFALAPEPDRLPRAGSVGLMGLERLGRQEKDDLEALVPMYIGISAAEARRNQMLCRSESSE